MTTDPAIHGSYADGTKYTVGFMMITHEDGTAVLHATIWNAGAVVLANLILDHGAAPSARAMRAKREADFLAALNAVSPRSEFQVLRKEAARRKKV